MTDKTTAYCLLGSNQGDRLALIRQAVFALAATEGVEVLRASAVYETAPWGNPDQPAFLNAAVELHTALEPEALLDGFQHIERRLGRAPSEKRWNPRFIDLDLALYGDRVIRTARLTLPHAHLAERLFALEPLLEIGPDLRDPASGISYARAADALRSRQSESGIKNRGPLIFHADSPENGGWEALQNLTRETPRGDREHADENPDSAIAHGRPALLFQSRAPADTERLAERLAAYLKGRETLALAGNLGAGKTCFARGLAKGLGIAGPITSPSYVLVKSYEGRLTLHHADFYRLAGTDAHAGENAPKTASRKSARPLAPEHPDLASLGLEDYLDDPDAVVLVEWADRYPDWIEPPFYLIEIAGAGEMPRFVLLRRIG